jgi:predicted RNase H-like HicB family nuclease/uncharacterized protein YegP (UPF0339 family)
MDRPKYRIEIAWSDEDGGYIANVPDLRYCSAFGETPEDALREVLVATELHLDTLDELGRPIPEAQARPTSLPSGVPETSGGAQFQVYRDSTGEYHWRFRAADGEIIVYSGESYASRDDALRAIRVFRDQFPRAEVEISSSQ